MPDALQNTGSPFPDWRSLIEYEDSVFAIPVFDNLILYSPLQQVYALGGEGLIIGLTEITRSSSSTKFGKLLAGISRPPKAIPAIRSGPLDPEFLSIIPSRSCNLSCRYCNFSPPRDENEVMDENLAMTAVDWMVAKAISTGRPELRVDFFGGEPMVAPQVVEVAVRRAQERAQKVGLDTRFEIQTNGCFNFRSCQFVADNFDCVMVSIDGPEDIQNYHRPRRDGTGSAETVYKNALWIARSPARLYIRTCVTSHTVGVLDKTAEWICRTFKPSAVGFEPLQLSPEYVNGSLQPPSPWEFAKMVQRASRVSASYGIPTIYISASIDRLRISNCPVGQDVLIICPDGQINACYLPEIEWKRRGLDFKLGRISSVGDLQIDREAVERVRALPGKHRKCNKCFCRWHCAGGCHVAGLTGEAGDEPENFCIQTRILTACQILDRLGYPELADRLVENRQAMEKLALKKSDTLQAWKAC